jgi:DNA replication ATP-dependent helicase Dna2
MVAWKKAGLEISTIDRYQGRDKPAIILSFVRSNPEGKVGRLVQDKPRLNVALTRAKSKLILVGSYSTLKNGSIPLGPLLYRIDSKQQRQLLPENALQCYQFT